MQYHLHVPEEVHRRRKVEDAADGASDPEEVKRRAAQARKEALMKQFKAQRASFAINLNEEDDEDEEMLDELDALVSYRTCTVLSDSPIKTCFKTPCQVGAPTTASLELLPK